MSEEAGETQAIEKIWASLSEEERDFLSLMSPSDWASGVDDIFLSQSVGISPEKIQELVSKGVLQQGTGESFAKEWLAIKSENLNEIRSRAPNTRSDNERELLEKTRKFLRIATSKKKEITGAPSYRMVSLELHDFSYSKLT